MNILAFEPFYRGSHRQFLDQFSAHSQHDWTIQGLPGRNWRWRMRHAPLTFHQQLPPTITPDLIFCSSMFNLTEFYGLRPELAKIPSVLYFHENQLTYPLPEGTPRDYHTVYMQFMACMSATEIWFNSHFHREEFFTALEAWFKKMPDYTPEKKVPALAEKSRIAYPPIEAQKLKTKPSGNRPIHILWVARLEKDKNFDSFHRLIEKLDQGNHPFEVSVIGKMTDDDIPFRQAFKRRIRYWGYQKKREDYLNALKEADLIISTANHEFFGLSVAEAVQAGCCPLLPNRLAYPEIYDAEANPSFFYNDENDLLQKMESILRTSNAKELFDRAKPAREKVKAYTWGEQIASYDQRLVNASM